MTAKDLRIITSAVAGGLAIGFLAGCQVTRPNDGAAALARGQAAFAACVAESCDRLNLDGARLTDYRYLSDLSHVSALMVSWTDFADMADITAMTQLTELHIGGTGLRDISGIGEFQNLRVLHIQDNDIADYSPIAQLGRLEEIALGGSGQTVSILAQMPSVRRLALTTAMDDLSPLMAHPGLQTIDFARVSDDMDFGLLSGMPRLTRINVLGFLTDAQEAQLAALNAEGVEVNFAEPVIVVC